MKDHLHPTPQVSDEAVVPSSRRHKAQGKTRSLRKPELKMTSMIDVVFLLLVFFVVTASFQIDEGTLQARLPGNSGPGTDLIEPPTLVDLSSADDGVTYRLQVNGVPIDSASELSDYMTNRVRTGLMASDDLVQIKPQGVVRWQHVLNVYNACVNAELTKVTFASR